MVNDNIKEPGSLKGGEALPQEQLQKATDRYQAILNSMDDGFVFCQLVRNEQGQAIDYRYLDFNAAFEKQRGLPIEHFVGRTVSQVHSDHHQWVELYAKVVNNHEPLKMEVSHNGTWYEIAAYPFKDDCFSVIFRNVDERKKTEEKLAATESTFKSQLKQEVEERTLELSESRLQYVSLVENTPDVITRWDKNLKLIFANSAFAGKTGRSLDELYGKTSLEMGLPAEVALSYMHSLKEVFTTGQPFEHLHAFPTPQGEVYYFSRIVPEKNEKGEVQTVLRIARDISPIKKAEEEILGLKDEIAQKVTDKYLTLFNTMEEGFLVIELARDETGKCINYKFLEVNPAFEKQIGMKPEDVVGRNVLDIFPTLDEWWLEMYGEIGNKKESTRFEQYLKENERWYESLAYPLWDQQVAVLYNDITERKRREQSQFLLSAISKELVELTVVKKTMQRLGKKIGKYFGVSWCMFAETDHENSVATYSWNAKTVASLKGKYCVRNFLSAEQRATNNAGLQSTVTDTQLEEHELAKGYADLGIRSLVITPLVFDQQWRFMLSLVHHQPRQWREDEMELLREIASRIWTRLERARAEEALRQSAEKKTFLLHLSDAIRSLADPIEIQSVVAQILGEHLKADRAYYAWVQGDYETVTIDREYLQGDVPSVVGKHAFADFRSVFEAYSEGKTLVLNDVEAEQAVPAADLPAYRVLAVRSLISTPLVKEGRTLGSMSVIKATPHPWTKEEIALVEEAGERTWAAVERAKAEEELRINKERMRYQKDAFQAAINGAPLEDSLNILARMVTSEVKSKVRTAFFLTSPDRLQLQPIPGAGDMFEAYKKQIEGFPIGEHSFGCGLAIAIGKPIMTQDVHAEPLWRNHLHLTKQNDFMAVGSFPIKTKEGEIVGSFAMYFAEIQEFTPQILAIAEAITQSAAFILSHNGEAKERARVEAALRKSEERLIITMESATDYAIITTDTEGLIERWSGGAAKIFLYTEEEVKGQPINIIFTDEDKTLGVPQKEMATAQNLGHATHERWHQRKDGSRFFVSGVIRPIYNPTLTGYVKVLRDATQEQLFTEELHRLVAKRTEELQRSNEDLRQFAHVASHDLKEPVRKIKIFQNRIKDEFSNTLPEKVNTYLSKMGNAADRMFAMIEGVLKYSKLDDSEQAEEWVDLNEIISDIGTDLELLMHQKNARISTENLPVVAGFRVLLYQLFYNLILNSLKFSRATIPACIEIRCEKVLQGAQTFYKIVLADNGIGFEEEYAEKIFITFTKLNSADEYEGTGLGLALCKKIVLRHSGTISATGIPNKGAAFTIMLPAK